MNLIELKACDVLVCINDRQDTFSKIKRWAMGDCEHVEMYLGVEFSDIPLLVESDNRGVVIQNLAHQDGRRVLVMRPNLSEVELKSLIREAVTIASDSKASYDWFGALRFAALRVLREKLGIERKRNQVKALAYERDAKMICSEAVAEIFWRSGINILSQDVVPIPEDFKYPDILVNMGEGNIVIAQDGNVVKAFIDID